MSPRVHITDIFVRMPCAVCIVYCLDQPMDKYTVTLNFYTLSTPTYFDAFASFSGSLIFYYESYNTCKSRIDFCNFSNIFQKLLKSYVTDVCLQ